MWQQKGTVQGEKRRGRPASLEKQRKSDRTGIIASSPGGIVCESHLCDYWGQWTGLITEGCSAFGKRVGQFITWKINMARKLNGYSRVSAYVLGIYDISSASVLGIYDISSTYVLGIYDISSAYVLGIYDISSAYVLGYIIGVCTRYLRYITYLTVVKIWCT